LLGGKVNEKNRMLFYIKSKNQLGVLKNKKEKQEREKAHKLVPMVDSRWLMLIPCEKILVTSW
jgi:hypothetical protein